MHSRFRLATKAVCSATILVTDEMLLGPGWPDTPSGADLMVIANNGRKASVGRNWSADPSRVLRVPFVHSRTAPHQCSICRKNTNKALLINREEGKLLSKHAYSLLLQADAISLDGLLPI